MSLIRAQNLSKSYGAQDIFRHLTLDIPPQARIAIVGANGIGKTTLLRILIGEEDPSEGKVNRARQISIGYLPQEATILAEKTLWKECLTAMEDILELEKQLQDLESKMAKRDAADDILEQYGELQEKFEKRGGYAYETTIRQTLNGLGFKEADFHRPIQQLSGGQRTRAYLARLLLSHPDLLILDEPTNHLDIQSVEWLEGYLSQWSGAALIVSHDRYFLDRVVNQIWEMSSNGLEVYRGNYTDYLQQRQERWQLRQNQFLAEKERLEKELDYIRRNISGQNTLQAKGRLRHLSRYLEAVEKGGMTLVLEKKWSEVAAQTGATSQMMSLDEATRRVNALHTPFHTVPSIALNLKPRTRSGDLVLRTYQLKIGYPDQKQALFEVPDLILKRGECAALIGPNGAGKTTFLKTLLGFLQPWAGEIVLGASLDVAYFAQAHEDLLPENTLMQEIERVAPHLLPSDIRNLLARFQFYGDDAYKKVAVLSGGERGRLALAKLSLSDANLLLLDEPTNHLDIPSQEILQAVLADYNGTILLVSHDRYLIDALATQIWEV
ncbi:MAG: ribosomal protection-like ABC-F family protein, partial [Anaerolineales bacterium]